MGTKANIKNFQTYSYSIFSKATNKHVLKADPISPIGTNIWDYSTRPWSYSKPYKKVTKTDLRGTKKPFTMGT